MEKKDWKITSHDCEQSLRTSLAASRADAAAALSLLSRMRFACGDDGKRMQDELEEYLRELKRDAERYRWLRDEAVHHGREDGLPTPWVVYGTCAGDATPKWEQDLDADIDAAMDGANA